MRAPRPAAGRGRGTRPFVPEQPAAGERSRGGAALRGRSHGPLEAPCASCVLPTRRATRPRPTARHGRDARPSRGRERPRPPDVDHLTEFVLAACRGGSRPWNARSVHRDRWPGVQLAAQVVARAAAAGGQGRHAVRRLLRDDAGGNSDSTVVVNERRDRGSAPRVPRWSAVVLHHKFWSRWCRSCGPAVVLLNSSLFEGEADRARGVFDVPPTDVAAELGNPMGASMVMAGAYVPSRAGRSWTAWSPHAGVDPLVRRQHVEQNEVASGPGSERPPAARSPHGVCRYEQYLTRGTVTIDRQPVRGVQLCIPACPPRCSTCPTPRRNELGYRSRAPAGCTAAWRACRSAPTRVRGYKYDTPSSGRAVSPER